MEEPSKMLILREFFNFKTIIFAILPLGIMLIYFMVTTHEYGGIPGIINTILTAVPLLVIAGIIANFCALGSDAIGWRLILSTNGIRPSFLRLGNVYLTSFVLGLLSPSPAAVEITIRTYMGRDFYNYNENRNATVGDILSSIILHRLLGVLAFIPLSIIVAAGFVIFLRFEPWQGLFFVLIIALLALFFIILISFVYLKPNIVIRFFGALPLLRNYKIQIQKIINDYNASLLHLGNHKKKAFIAYFFTLGTALCSYLSGIFIVYSLDPEISYFVVIVVIFLSDLLNLLPVPIPGLEGLRGITISWLVETYKPNPTKSAALSILISLSRFYIVIIVGILIHLVTQGFFLKEELKKDMLGEKNQPQKSE